MDKRSFVENVNLLVKNLDTIISAQYLFDPEIVAILKQLTDLDLKDIANDLAKGSVLGKRKLDINLLLNMRNINDSLTNEEKAVIWNTETVFYDYADIVFSDGSTFRLNFIFDGVPTLVATHSDLLLQFNNSAYLLSKLSGTLMRTEPIPITIEFLRVVDTISEGSNLRSIMLHADSGQYSTRNVYYYWANTTSALEVLVEKVQQIKNVGDNIEAITLLANTLNQLLVLEQRIPELVDTFTGNIPNGDETIYNNLPKLLKIYDNLIVINKAFSQATPDSMGLVYTASEQHIQNGTAGHMIDAAQLKLEMSGKFDNIVSGSIGITKDGYSYLITRINNIDRYLQITGRLSFIGNPITITLPTYVYTDTIGVSGTSNNDSFLKMDYIDDSKVTLSLTDGTSPQIGTVSFILLAKQDRTSLPPVPVGFGTSAVGFTVFVTR